MFLYISHVAFSLFILFDWFWLLWYLFLFCVCVDTWWLVLLDCFVFVVLLFGVADAICCLLVRWIVYLSCFGLLYCDATC